MLPKGNVQMKKPPRCEKANVLHLDPYDVVHYLWQEGHSFMTIARDIPICVESGSTKTNLTGSELKEWYEKDSARRRVRGRG